MRVRTALAFAAIFIIWGATYLAIKYAVTEIPPLLTAGLRHVIAGAVLLAWTRAKGLRASRVEWGHSLVVGALFFLIGHGTLHWAEQSVPSGVSALLVATEPVWIAIFLALTGRAPLRGRTIAGLLLGLVGVAVLVRFDAGADPRSLLIGSVAILVGAASWGAGVVYGQRVTLPRDPLLRTATTLLCGAGLLLAAAASTGELAHVPVPSPRALGSLAFLVVFGSIVAFSAYYWLLDRFPATLVATHTYVNPAVAVVLGWALGGETVSASLVVGLAIITSAIALVSSSEIGSKPEPVPLKPDATINRVRKSVGTFVPGIRDTAADRSATR
jgi:drug/metabolite transporter (DMT)-like permease